MKKVIFKNIAILALALAIWLLPAMALAAKMDAKADKASVSAGDTVEVIVTVSGKDMAIAEGIFTYDPAILTYAESEGGASDGLLNMVSAEKGGSDTLSARIRFTAAGAGSTKIALTIEKVLSYDGKEQEGAQASVSVEVAAPKPTPAPAPIDYAAKGVAAKNVKGASGERYIWRSLENVTVPARYSVTTLSYHGETVAAAKVEDSDAPVLLYLSNATGDEGSYYIFDEAADVLYPYQTVSSVSKSYIIMEPDSSAPEGFAEATLTIGEKEYRAWKSRDGIVLLYARNPDGDVGYFVYNAEDESLQRYAVMPARPVLPDGAVVEPTPEAVQPAPTSEPAPAPEPEGAIAVSGVVFYAICGIGVLMALAIVILLVARANEKARRKREAASRQTDRELGC